MLLAYYFLSYAGKLILIIGIGMFIYDWFFKKDQTVTAFGAEQDVGRKVVLSSYSIIAVALMLMFVALGLQTLF